jgi:hypothetical protein
MILKEKIQKKLDVLEYMMKNNVHIADPNGCMEYSCSISKFWSVLSEEDRDFIQGCQSSIEEGLEWK